MKIIQLTHYYSRLRGKRFYAVRTFVLIVHNAEVQAVQTEEVSVDEMWSFVSKNRNSVVPEGATRKSGHAQDKLHSPQTA